MSVDDEYPTPLATRSSREHAALPRRSLLIPLGSFEQHGPHLPLATDSIIAAAICRDVALVRAVDVAPPVSFSASGEHTGFAGLLSIGTEVTCALLIELVRSSRDSWSSVLFVSGHGGNLDALKQVCALARDEGDAVAHWVPRDPSGDAHAGATETSVMLSIDHSLVHLEHLDLSGPSEPLAPDWMHIARHHGVKAVSSSGVLGNPLAANANDGWVLRHRWCAEVVKLIDLLEEST